MSTSKKRGAVEMDGRGGEEELENSLLATPTAKATLTQMACTSMVEEAPYKSPILVQLKAGRPDHYHPERFKMLSTERELPNVRIEAKASNDGKRITLTFPYEFIGTPVSLSQSYNGRAKIIINPIYGGKDIVGRVGPDGVKYGFIEFNPKEAGIQSLIPGATGVWFAKQYENALLIGSLIADLSEKQADPASAPQPEIDGMIFGEKFASGEHRVSEAPKQHVPIDVKSEINIEEAVTFVNKWASENKATLVVNSNKLLIEVIRVIGG